jgi:antitoxin YefM
MKSYLDNVVNDQRPLYVTRANGEDVVVLSKSDYEGLQETYYLMSSPKMRNVFWKPWIKQTKVKE